jgi:hypothetical protein
LRLFFCLQHGYPPNQRSFVRSVRIRAPRNCNLQCILRCEIFNQSIRDRSLFSRIPVRKRKTTSLDASVRPRERRPSEERPSHNWNHGIEWADKTSVKNRGQQYVSYFSVLIAREITGAQKGLDFSECVWLHGRFRALIIRSRNHREKNISTEQHLSQKNSRFPDSDEDSKWTNRPQAEKGKRTHAPVRLMRHASG